MATDIDWPSTLPQYVLVDGYNKTLLSNTVVSQNSVGPTKVRRRNTKKIYNYTVNMPMTKTELNTFETFFTNTIGYGALSFNFPDPEDSDEEIEVRLITTESAGYNVTPENGSSEYFIVGMQLESV